MKIYCYYLIDSDVINYLSENHYLETLAPAEPNDKYFFYGFTEDKSIAKKFAAIHDMKKFMVKEKHLDKTDYKIFKERFRSFHYIEECDLICAEDKRIIIPMTSGEYWYCVEEQRETVSELLLNMVRIPPIIFTDKWFVRLDELEYPKYYNGFIHDEGEYDHDMLDTDTELHDFVRNNGWKNQLGLYLHIYRHIVNPELVLLEGKYEKHERYYV